MAENFLGKLYSSRTMRQILKDISIDATIVTGQGVYKGESDIVPDNTIRYPQINRSQTFCQIKRGLPSGLCDAKLGEIKSKKLMFI